jgi:hypothetical protein
MDGREKMTEPKPAAKKRQGANFESAGNWQLATSQTFTFILHCRVYLCNFYGLL